MVVGFIIWSVVAALMLGIGLWAWKAKKPVGFFAGVKPPEVKNVVKYNHAVAKIWFAYAALFGLCGVPLLFLKQNSPYFVLSILGVVFASIGIAVAYHLVLSKYEK